jgi:hypothetical protein
MASPQAVRVSFALALRDVVVELDQGQGGKSGATTRTECAPTAPALHSDSESTLVATCCLLFKLTHAESLALVKLLESKHASREALRGANSNPLSGSKGVDVIIHRLRGKLAPYDIEIVTVRGQGFGLTATARDKLRKLLADYDAGAPTTSPPTARAS